jgi:hypothetical protein
VVDGKLAHVRGTHAPPSGATQWLNTHVSPLGQVAHVSSTPQPSSVCPHWMPSCVQLSGTQALPASTGTHWLLMQLLPAAHGPHSAVTPPQPLAP